MRIAILCLGLLAACGGPTANADTFTGSWVIDFDASWDLSKDSFLKDTPRGADAYPKDPAEREKAIRKEMSGFLADFKIVAEANRAVTETVGGRSTKGTYRLLSADGSKMSIEFSVGRKRTIDVEFKNEDLVHWTIIARANITLVLKRTGG